MKRAHAAILRYFKRADLWLLGLALVIALYGLAAIYGVPQPRGGNRYVMVQGLAIAAGSAGFVLASMLDLRRFPRLWIAVFALNVLFQLSLYFFGVEGDTGNKSWIPIPGTGVNVQPGEVGKIIFIFTLASHIRRLKETGRLNAVSSMIQLVAHMGVTSAAVFAISRDMGVALAYPIIFLFMLFAAGVSLWWLLAGLLAMAGMAFPLWQFMGPNQQERILVVFDPTLFPDKAWHAQQSIAALQRGGLAGVGLGQGRYFVNNHNDFIFAAICEQFGFIGGAALLALLTLLVLRILYDGARSEDIFGRVLCMGVAGMFMFQILINVGMCMGVMPVIGITLPLVSYGGSSVAAAIAGLGFVSGACVRQRPDWIRNTQ